MAPIFCRLRLELAPYEGKEGGGAPAWNEPDEVRRTGRLRTGRDEEVEDMALEAGPDADADGALGAEVIC